MILVIFVSFLVCYLPITIVKVTHTTHSSPGGDFFSDCRRSLAPLLVPAGLHLDLPQHLHQPHHLRPDVHRVPTGLLQPPNLSQLSPSRDKVSSTQIYHVHSNFSLRLGRWKIESSVFRIQNLKFYTNFHILLMKDQDSRTMKASLWSSIIKRIRYLAILRYWYCNVQYSDHVVVYSVFVSKHY